MKTTKFYITLFLLTFFGINAIAQKIVESQLFESIPEGIPFNDEVQKYVVTTDHFNGDIFGNFFHKFRVKGEYTRGLGNGKVKWNNVTVAMAMQRDADFPAGSKLSYMEDYSYVPSADMLKPENFETFAEHGAYAKNLIWDIMGIEGMAWMYFEKLELNKPFEAKKFNGEMDLAGQGSFENRNMILTWTGVSKFNNEKCATIQYRTMDNPVEYAEEAMSMKGRSHYWGTIWISLEDKQIEHANMFEDVIMEMQLQGQNGKQLMDAVREITVEKIITDSQYN